MGLRTPGTGCGFIAPEDGLRRAIGTDSVYQDRQSVSPARQKIGRTTMSNQRSTAGRLGAIAFTLLASSAFGQVITFGYSYGYYTNAGVSGVPDSQLSIVNPGSTGGTSPGGDLCANIYVLDTQNDIRECCSCKVTPNGITTFSLNTNLTANPFKMITLPVNGVNVSVPTGVIEVVSSVATKSGSTSVCGGAQLDYSPNGQLAGWITHVHQPETGAFSLSEAPLLPGTLSAGTLTGNGPTELSRLQSLCNLVQSSGDRTGICTCPVE
jgi:hypothetical protein